MANRNTAVVVGLVLCYPDGRLLPALVNLAPPPERMRQTIRNGRSADSVNPPTKHMTSFSGNDKRVRNTRVQKK